MGNAEQEIIAEYTGNGPHLHRRELWKDESVLCQELRLGMKRRLGKGKLGDGCDDQENTEEAWWGQADSEVGRLRHIQKYHCKGVALVRRKEELMCPC